MSVTNTVTVAANGLYVPFRGVARAGGPVGTLHVHGQVTGDGGGGSASILISSQFLEFGFHPLYAATRINTLDLSVTLQNVRFQFDEVGNERINHDYHEVVVPVEAPANNNHANMSFLGIPIEPIRGGGTILAALWETNNNTIDYDFHAFFMVYDLEVMAKSAGRATIDTLTSGIR